MAFSKGQEKKIGLFEAINIHGSWRVTEDISCPVQIPISLTHQLQISALRNRHFYHLSTYLAKATIMTSTAPPARSLQEARIPSLPSSAYYIPDFITPAEESALLHKVILYISCSLPPHACCAVPLTHLPHNPPSPANFPPRGCLHFQLPPPPPPYPRIYTHKLKNK